MNSKSTLLRTSFETSAWKSCGVIVTPLAWRMSGSSEKAPNT